MNEIQLGEVTYVIHRSFAETRSVPDLIVRRLLEERTGKTAFDEGSAAAYNHP